MEQRNYIYSDEENYDSCNVRSLYILVRTDIPIKTRRPKEVRKYHPAAIKSSVANRLYQQNKKKCRKSGSQIYQIRRWFNL